MNRHPVRSSVKMAKQRAQCCHYGLFKANRAFFYSKKKRLSFYLKNCLYAFLGLFHNWETLFYFCGLFLQQVATVQNLVSRQTNFSINVENGDLQSLL